MRLCTALAVLCALAVAEDFVHLENGGVLRGAVVEERADAIVLDLGGGRIRLPRAHVRLVERGASRDPVPRTVTQRDDWFLVLHRDKVVGWRREVLTAGPRWLTAEEHTVFFRPGGGDDVGVRRVETAARDGTPRDFLFMEVYGKRMEVVTGRRARGRVVARVLRDGEWTTRELDLPEGWRLALPAWSRFLENARPGESRTLTALDPRRLRTVSLLLDRGEDTAAPGGVRRCRALRLRGEARSARALYRPGEGALAVELNGKTLVARRTTRARVELARRAHAAPEPLTVEEALRFPFYTRPKELTVYLPRPGLSLRAPDAGWLPHPSEVDDGLVASFEKIGLFASVDAFVYRVGEGVDADACLRRALGRLKLTAKAVEVVGDLERGTHRGMPLRTLRLAAHHRGEDLRCVLAVVRAPDRYVVLVGACPSRWWRWAESDFAAFVDSLVVVP